jgi:excinuclease ABC subunit B
MPIVHKDEPSGMDEEGTAESTAASEGRFVNYPDSPFQLFQPYAPAGDQPTAIV